jgi:pectin methylesterase-like acyl-CoA thioesterase
MDVNGYVTAASTPLGQKYGYVFFHCTLSSKAAEQTVYLGRPWRVKITFDDYALKLSDNGEKMGTFGSYSCIVTGDYPGACQSKKQMVY